MRFIRSLLVCSFLICSGAAGEETDRLVLGTFPFEQDPAPDWVDDAGTRVSTIGRDNPRSGTGCFHVVVGNKSGVLCHYRYGFNLPVLTDPRARMLRVTLWVRTRDVHPGEVSVVFLKSYDQGRLEWLYPDYQSPRNNTFISLPVNSEWTQVQGEGLVAPDVRGLTIYLRVGNRSGKAQVWLDDMTVELLDRAVMLPHERLGNIYRGEQAQMDLVVSAPEKIVSGSVRLVDEEDRLIGTVEIQPGMARVPVVFPTRGYYNLRAEVSYSDGVHAAIGTTAAVVGPDIPEELRRGSAFGVNCGNRGDLHKLSGARWDRDYFSWRREDYQQAAEAGFPPDRKPVIHRKVLEDRDTVFVFCEQPEWFQDRQGRSYPSNEVFYFPPKDWNQFGTFIQYVLRSIEGKVGYVEVANEPDSWQGPWSGLVRYHREMTQALKSVNPEIKFMGPGFCNIEMSKVKAMVDAGLLDCIDAFSIHPYVNGTAPEEEFIAKVRELKSYLASVGRKDLPIILSEYGWTLPPGDWQKPVDPLTQARYVSRSSILLVAEQIDAFIYFLTMGAENWGYGLLNYWDSSPLPGFSAFANAARMLTGVSGPGRCLKLTPTTWMTLFRKGSGTLAAVWDVKGSSTAFVPTPWSVARDMTGRPIKEASDGAITVSPSPIFIEIADPAFYEMTPVKTVDVTRGGTVPWAGKPAWVPSTLKVDGDTLRVPEDAPAGEYLVIEKSSDGWKSIKMNVKMIVEIEAAEILWPENETAPKLQVRIRSNHDDPLTVSETFRLTGREEIVHSGQILPPNTVTEPTLPLPQLEPAKRYQGQFIVEAMDVKSPVGSQVPLDLTIVPCGSDLRKLPGMDFSSWAPFDSNYKTVAPFSPADCSAQLQAGYDDQGLHLLIAVRDNVHQQAQSAKDMWKEDSIQVSFDMDAEKPWRANVGGCNGHFKVFEYGFALTDEGPVNWRWISYDRDLPADVSENRVKCQIGRRDNVTVYDVTFPWSTLGLTARPKGGSAIGFAVVVNDFDAKDSQRKGLTLFSGIVSSKDPAEFGKLWLR